MSYVRGLRIAPCRTAWSFVTDGAQACCLTNENQLGTRGEYALPIQTKQGQSKLRRRVIARQFPNNKTEETYDRWKTKWKSCFHYGSESRSRLGDRAQARQARQRCDSRRT